MKAENGEEIPGNLGLFQTAFTLRIPVGGDLIPIEPGTFGTIDVRALLLGCLIIVPCDDPNQSWVASLIGASGRFSVGAEAIRLDDACQ